LGFDVVTYNLSRTKELFNTEEFPSLKNGKTKDECKNLQGHIIETGDYPAEEIYISPNNDCYQPTLFFSFTKGRYIYNLVPRIKERASVSGDTRIEITDNFPEFFSVASSLAIVDIIRPKPKPAKPKITAPMPVSYKVVNGRMVCAKKHDKPHKSKQHKKSTWTWNVV
jgi:hypothetical protein